MMLMMMMNGWLMFGHTPCTNGRGTRQQPPSHTTTTRERERERERKRTCCVRQTRLRGTQAAHNPTRWRRGARRGPGAPGPVLHPGATCAAGAPRWPPRAAGFLHLFSFLPSFFARQTTTGTAGEIPSLYCEAGGTAIFFIIMAVAAVGVRSPVPLLSFCGACACFHCPCCLWSSWAVLHIS